MGSYECLEWFSDHRYRSYVGCKKFSQHVEIREWYLLIGWNWLDLNGLKNKNHSVLEGHIRDRSETLLACLYTRGLWHCPQLMLTFIMHHRIVLGKIQTSDGPTNAYTIIRGRWVGKSHQLEEKFLDSPLLLAFSWNCFGQWFFFHDLSWFLVSSKVSSQCLKDSMSSLISTFALLFGEILTLNLGVHP